MPMSSGNGAKYTTLFLLLLGFLLAGLVFLYLWQGTALAKLRAERAALVLSVADLERQKLFLEHKLREAYSPEVLSERAKALGMGPVDLSRLHYLVIPDENGR
ncbi:MAG: hypothetical protein ACP5LJ_05225 [Candidatus Bipolaricaulaceae bacterium]